MNNVKSKNKSNLLELSEKQVDKIYGGTLLNKNLSVLIQPFKPIRPPIPKT